jgi:hypothetical protein
MDSIFEQLAATHPTVGGALAVPTQATVLEGAVS